MRKIKSLNQFAEPYKAVLCDLWGVVHNGNIAYPDAVETLQTLKNNGIIVVLLSNSPKPINLVTRRLEKIGITDGHYDALITSGSLTQSYMTKTAADQSYYHIGPRRDRGLLEGIRNIEMSNIDESDVILCTGFFEHQPLELENYKQDFLKAIRKSANFICANPDREVDISGKRMPCAGMLAEYYEGLGGDVVWLGKPKKIAYETAIDAIKKITGINPVASETLAIGDNLETDIAGAHRMGMNTILISEGLHGHRKIGEKDFEALMVRLQVRPDAVMKKLKWK